ncbi:4Fe-4S dicluster domain-containing protein [Clostridium sp. Cult2]|uniref:4Fe-4S dicluster domain-containing protein n=1 Tax=Clostridium sp. Cult2 TaxID=2079003 RepID=UPI001F24D066|nr:4Fe-4S binding protein [Clostridium sp. Cult2]MCF6464518.1 aldehyde:ferredoxin oxidoreductase [Clostridium sp. Cult2]
MKYLVANPELCIECRACEEACSKAYFKENNREKSRIRIGGNNSRKKITACTQCGECIDICPVEALYRDEKGIVRLDKKKCVGCFMCVGFCPEFAMFDHEDYLEPFNCIACGICVNSCPTEAIHIEEK